MKKVITFRILILCFFMSCNSQAQDWANLNKYKKANTELKAPTSNENRVVFMGNSITEGWSNAMPSFFENKNYINRGISGQTTPQMLLRFRQDVINLNPKVVVILAGTNDIAGNTGPTTLNEITDNIKSMAELATKNNIKVIISSTLPAFDYPWAPNKNPNTKIPKLNAMLKSYATDNNFIYLDYFSAMATKENGLRKEHSGDGVHPNKKGYQLMAPLAKEAIAKALKK
ncbi:MAG: SGNH/GDSL hydrolase family protein [Cellulophaga sp.]|uniref:SGNH/GDSL hydrolase family protein n=1 Tax=unclassified Cellulophaga TaxID=2634405 RepID=UPI000C2B77B8|nr:MULTISPECIES: SGNH/GDSL hydrolase family protein [unclassified Cellulophaga]MDO6491589.1 SGNH/GDSL hydrolase family protein [Cellulophaga sp. 2_MG-2023]MDO6493466.1 SGNH/GDSL hydrolase family protein [Cellulophaga sp. 3_MG-2023]PKB44545.1 lysophospholipase L1-like esterase [Cellulophaga sp. RHA19]